MHQATRAVQLLAGLSVLFLPSLQGRRQSLEPFVIIHDGGGLMLDIQVIRILLGQTHLH